MQFATWNINSLKVRLEHVLQWLQIHPVDVLCLQELKLDQDQFPLADIEAAGYQATWFGQKTYNGVAILARQPWTLDNITFGIPGYEDEQRRVIAATINGIRAVCAYFVNGASLDSPKYTYKLNWLDHLERYIAEALTLYPDLILLGDYNIAPADLDVYDPLAWQDQVLCSPAERSAFQRLLDLGLHDAFRLLHPDIQAYTWWDYRAMMFRRNLGLRIDHILISQTLKIRANTCSIDKTPRKWERPSDHAPVILTLN